MTIPPFKHFTMYQDSETTASDGTGSRERSDNELIEEFMGLPLTKQRVKFTGGFETVPFRTLRYDTSWDWLMPVVEKINKTWEHSDMDGDQFLPGEMIIQRLRIALGNVDLKNAHAGVTDFIRWHNLAERKQPITAGRLTFDPNSGELILTPKNSNHHD